MILPWFFNAVRGSTLVSILFHWQLNMPMCLDAQPRDMYLFVVLAGIVVWVRLSVMFGRAGVMTEVMLAQQEATREVARCRRDQRGVPVAGAGRRPGAGGDGSSVR